MIKFKPMSKIRKYYKVDLDADLGNCLKKVTGAVKQIINLKLPNGPSFELYIGAIIELESLAANEQQNISKN